MKIGVNSRTLQNHKTGIQKYTESLYQHLTRLCSRENFVFLQTNKKQYIGKTKTLDLPKNCITDFLFDNFLINKLTKQENIDIFHGPANIIPFRKNKGVKYIVTIHDLSFLHYPSFQSKILNFYYKHCIGRSLQNADIIIADSINTKKDIIKFYHIPKNKIQVIYLGIDNIYFKTSKMQPLIKNKYFLSVITHRKRKNIHSILKILALNKNKLKNYKYVIVGPALARHTALKNEIKKLGLITNVIWFGYAKEKELISLYQNAEFFIYPSLYEGFGIPVLEAMACKCPVITSNNSSLKEIVPNKDWLVNPNDLEDIYDRMKQMLNLSKEQRTTLIETNFHFSQKFTWDKTAKQMINIFNNL